jgi:DNA-binding MarR family transcriptional regulator
MNLAEIHGATSLARHGERQHPVKEPPPLSRAQMRRLAEFRFQLRKFLHFSSLAANATGIRTQQYQLLQCVWGMPEELDPTIANVAARMLLKHNSAVELVDRTIEQGLLRRCPDPTDHRRILLRMTPLGEKLLGLAGRVAFTRTGGDRTGTDPRSAPGPAHTTAERQSGTRKSSAEAGNAHDSQLGKRRFNLYCSVRAGSGGVGGLLLVLLFGFSEGFLRDFENAA